MSTELVTKKELEFSMGSENFYQHQLSQYIYSDGVASIAEKGYHWLVDAILISIRHTANTRKLAAGGELLICELTVKDQKADLIIKHENVITGDYITDYTQHFGYTDAQIEGDKLIFWFRHDVLYLPSEN